MGIEYCLLWMCSSYIILAKSYGIETGAWITYASVNWRRLRTIWKEDFVFGPPLCRGHPSRLKAEGASSMEIFQWEGVLYAVGTQRKLE